MSVLMHYTPPMGDNCGSRYINNLNITGFTINTDKEGNPQLELIIKSIDFGKAGLEDRLSLIFGGKDVKTIIDICRSLEISPSVDPHAEIPEGVKSLYK